jgi:hypothetical protein
MEQEVCETTNPGSGRIARAKMTAKQRFLEE